MLFKLLFPQFSSPFKRFQLCHFAYSSCLLRVTQAHPPHAVEENPEAPRGQVTYPRSHST